MADWLTRTSAQLADTKAGWVTRRDAADALGQVACKALDALAAHKNEADVDVRMAIERVLKQAASRVNDTAPAPSSAPSLKDLVADLAKEGSRSVEPNGDGFRVCCTLPENRAQTVSIDAYTRKDGATWVRVLSVCGPYTESGALWSLKTNLELQRCAIAVDAQGEQPMFVLRALLPLDGLTARALKEAVKEAAFSADWMEAKLTRGDTQ